MTQATITRPRHLTMRAWRWERRKTSLLPVAATAALFGLLGALSGCWNYQYNQEIYAEQQTTWQAVLIVGRTLASVPCYWAVGSVITAAGLWIREFSGLAAAGLLGSILAMAIRVAAPGLSWLMPFALPVNAMVAKGGDELFSFSDMAGWAGIGLAWVIALYGVARRRAARMEA